MLTELIARFDSAEAAQSACHTLPKRCPILVECRVSEGRFLHARIEGETSEPVEAILRASGARDVIVVDTVRHAPRAPRDLDLQPE
jgi:hypothetical protein